MEKIPIKCEKISAKIDDNKVSIPNKTNPFLKTNRKTLILDLDETLIHCDFDSDYQNHDVYIVANFDGECGQIPIMIRPYLREFLEFARDNFEVIIYTASDQDYADYILDHLDPEDSIFTYRLYRTSCFYIKDKITTKPLSIIENRKLEDIILVDNSIYAFILNLENGYLISSYYNDKSDNQLKLLEEYLKVEILNSKCDDVRQVNKNKFKLYSNSIK